MWEDSQVERRVASMGDRRKGSVARAGSMGERVGGDQAQKVCRNWNTWDLVDHVKVLFFILKAMGSH